ncbi:hypothetical protein [Bradyrhizobium sp.]|uniref:hypothetical protein n=1 Tax=Bradyrhizobium sp. TaxID=376 RepID=UPI003C51AAE7
MRSNAADIRNDAAEISGKVDHLRAILTAWLHHDGRAATRIDRVLSKSGRAARSFGTPRLLQSHSQRSARGVLVEFDLTGDGKALVMALIPGRDRSQHGLTRATERGSRGIEGK